MFSSSDPIRELSSHQHGLSGGWNIDVRPQTIRISKTVPNHFRSQEPRCHSPVHFREDLGLHPSAQLHDLIVESCEIVGRPEKKEDSNNHAWRARPGPISQMLRTPWLDDRPINGIPNEIVHSVEPEREIADILRQVPFQRYLEHAAIVNGKHQKTGTET